LAACETAPVGPGRSIDAAQSSIQFTHPLYPDVQGEYTQRSGSYSSQTETAFFPGKTGAVFVSYNQSAGDTYFSTTDVHEIVESIDQGGGRTARYLPGGPMGQLQRHR
jgi:hypothetical protein